jgi:hypothetical protein
MAYGPSEKYVSHVDYYDRDSRFFGNDVTKFGGQRIMTALLYLTSCKGGETVFRKGPTNDVGKASCRGKCVLRCTRSCSTSGVADRAPLFKALVRRVASHVQ